MVVSAWSALVPQQIENSSLPLAYFDVTVRNYKSSPWTVGVAFSWQDVIGRNIFDASTAQLDSCYPNNTGPATCALNVNNLMQCIGGWGLEACELNGRTRCRDMDRVSTEASPLTVGAMSGVEQRATAGHLSPNKLTMQQYNNRVAVLVEQLEQSDQVSVLKSYAPSQTDASSAGVKAWQAWAKTGRFPSSAQQHKHQSASLYRPPITDASSSTAHQATESDVKCDGALRDTCAGERQSGGRASCLACSAVNTDALKRAGCTVAAAEAFCDANTTRGLEAASAVALRTVLKAGEVRTIRFVVTWHAPELSAEGRTDNRTVCGTTDVNRMYHNRFAGRQGLERLVAFATAAPVRKALRAGTVEWHLPVLASTMPGFLQVHAKPLCS